jgi:hypothetical protein
MQLSFTLNNFDVSPSACNPGDGVSEVVLSLSHQKEKNQKNRNTTKFPKFRCNTVTVSFQHAGVLWLLSHQRKTGKKKRVWRQLCECLSEAAAHPPAAVTQL